MDIITEKLSQYFTPKQIDFLKNVWKFGQIGDAKVIFNDKEEYSICARLSDVSISGKYTNKQISSNITNITKKINETKNNLIKINSNIIYINHHKFGFENSTIAWNEFNNWCNLDK